ncbi:helix-hairpin-helix domain-containing protein [Bacteroides ihuae]|uniref:helix-hairpin-helix domain-containing protein n=1 Tax=Bacteroides ihuae TaxID=1852362 RepID=UPI0008DA4F5D|nr:helix-hairpin-helix domain-containing protein [Bacteroides ihuae]
MWKDFFYFSGHERQGIIILIVCIAIVVICTLTLTLSDHKEKAATKDNFKKEYADFIHSLKKRDYRTFYAYAHDQRHEIRLAPFDPNMADSATFVSLGLQPWMAHNIMRYRAKGGKFRKPEEFKKVYGLTEKQYTSLLPYIYVSDTFQKKDTTGILIKRNFPDSLKVIKYATGTVIDLNLSDTTELKKIPGIGGGIARMIVSYRKRLGGFYRIEQLNEINLNVEKVRPWFRIGNEQTRRINLNRASIERLKAHPYLNFYQAKVIVEQREKYGPLKSLKQLVLYSEFTQKDFERISHYIRFE